MQTPGPGTYRTVDPQIYGNRSAAYTLHIRGPLPSDNSKTPGPGAHSPEKVYASGIYSQSIKVCMTVIIVYVLCVCRL